MAGIEEDGTVHRTQERAVVGGQVDSETAAVVRFGSI